MSKETSGNQYLIRHFGHFPALPFVNPPRGPMPGMDGAVDVALGFAPQGPMPLVLNYVTSVPGRVHITGNSDTCSEDR